MIDIRRNFSPWLEHKPLTIKKPIQTYLIGFRDKMTKGGHLLSWG